MTERRQRLPGPSRRPTGERALSIACTVRGCSLLLSRDAEGLACAAGHRFDRAREGYWNLLQPQDRRSRRPGDSAAALAARRRWVERGHAQAVLEAVADLAGLPALGASAVVVDLGCGEGAILARLTAGYRGHAIGIDLSVRAVRLAAALLPEATLLVANADRRIPLADASVDRVLSLFGRRPAREIARVLRPGGRLVVAQPGPDDLIELRRAAHARALPRERHQALAGELEPAGLSPDGRRAARTRVRLSPADRADALALTYRRGRPASLPQLEDAASLEVTLSAEISCFRRQA